MQENKMELPKKYFNLKKGIKLKINGKTYTIKEKISKDKITRYELGDNYVLEWDNEWSFFKLETKKFLWFETTKSKNIKIESIEISS